MRQNKPIYAYKFKFYSYDKKTLKNIHNNNNFKRINKIWHDDTNYLSLTIKLLKTFEKPAQTKVGFT